MRALLLPLLATLAVPAIAQTTATAKPAEAPKTGPDRMVCHTEEALGSRLGGKRVCKTAREWGQINNEERLNLDRRTSNVGPQG